MAMSPGSEKRSAAKFLKAAGVTPRPSQLDLLGQVLGVVLPIKASPSDPVIGEARGIRLISIKNLVPDPNNPRGKIGDLGELVASIETFGVLQPLMVRPMSAPHARGEKFMIVVGHRRCAGGERAGLKELPCIVRPMTDAQALEIQLIENCQRVDLRPLDEADSYARLVAEFAHTPETIAKRVGKSKSWVIARLKLRMLGPAGREALSSGRLNPTLAVPVARIKDHRAQAKYLERACPEDGPPMPVRAALELLHAEHARSLKSPPFDTRDKDLVPEAGACTACPRRSGAVDGITDDLKGHDTCTGPECFDKKAKAAWLVATEKYRAEGIEVLPIAKGQALFKSQNQLVWDGPYVDVHAPAPDDPKKRSWEKLIGSLPKDKVAVGAERVQRVVAADLKMKPRQLYPRDQVMRALSDFGIAWAAKHVEEKVIESDAGAARERFAAERLEREVRNRSAAVIVARVFKETSGVKRPEARLMLDLMEEQLPAGERTPEKEVDDMDLSQLLRQCFRATLRGFENAWQGYDERLLELAKRHGIDVRMIENAIKRELGDGEISKVVATALNAPLIERAREVAEEMEANGELGAEPAGWSTGHKSAAHNPDGTTTFELAGKVPATVTIPTAASAKIRDAQEAIAEDGEPQPVDPESQDPDVEAEQLSQDETAPEPNPESLTTPPESEDF